MTNALLLGNFSIDNYQLYSLGHYPGAVPGNGTGGDAENPQERTSVRDWGERGQTGTASLNSAYAGPEGARPKAE